MKLIIPGLARTGTKSLWVFFQKHPDVSASKFKEPIRINKGLNNYFDNFEITESTKFLFDGTPELTNSSIMRELIAYPDIEEIYQIWFVRNSLDRIESLVRKYKTMSIEIRKVLPKFNDDMELQLKHAKSILGPRNIFVGKITESNIERKIEQFLGIMETNIAMTWEKH